MEIPADVRQHAESVARHAYWNELVQWGYTLYFAAFAGFALLLLVAVLLPQAREEVPTSARLQAVWRRLANWRMQIALISLAALLGLGAIAHQTNIDQRRGFIADREKRYEAAMKRLSGGAGKDEALRMEYLYMPEGNSLRYMSLGNTGIAADYVWLTSLQYVSNSFRRGQKFEMLSRFYRTVMDLDPHWIECALNGGKVLSALEPNRRLVEKFYIEAVLQNPADWKLPYEAAQLFIFPPLNPRDQREYGRTAVDWLDTALKRKSCPLDFKSTIEDMKAKLSLEAGYYESAAEILLKHGLNPDNPEAFRMAALRDWLYAQSIVQTGNLQKLVDKFKEGSGKSPASLDDIFKLLPDKGERMRTDEFGYPMEYDPGTGKVASRGVNVRRALQAESVIGGLAQNFKNDKGRLPKDLEEIQAWVGTFFTTEQPAQANVTDALGPNVNVISGPLGKWEYNAETGTVILPPDCTSKQLYRNADKMMEKAPKSNK